MAQARQAPSIRKKSRRRFTLDDLQLFFLSLPTTIWYLLFSYLPMFGIIIAFKRYRMSPRGFLWSLFFNSEWSGLDNFRFLFSSNAAKTWMMFRNTVGYNLVFITLGVVVPVTLAILISHLYSRKLAKACQTAIFLPHFLSWVVVGYFVYAFLATKEGLVNNMLRAAGATPVNWYQAGGAQYWPFLLVLLQMWKTMGYGMVVYMAAISGIDSSLYEAAVIDGASKPQQTRFITLPLLRPIISIMFILAIGRIFNSDFGLFYRSTRNSNSLVNVYTTIDVYVYNALFNTPQPVYGYVSAAGFLQSVLGSLTLLFANSVVKRIDRDSSLF
ncbi:MAG TPA: ABC transporter permease subunit [Candidatus Limnocylindria bacterium]|nr:ABC transporter permease subunit [Candidatus Limnocylindria bacterium]